jgi:hypothetical protein
MMMRHASSSQKRPGSPVPPTKERERRRRRSVSTDSEWVGKEQSGSGNKRGGGDAGHYCGFGRVFCSESSRADPLRSSLFVTPPPSPFPPPQPHPRRFYFTPNPPRHDPPQTDIERHGGIKHHPHVAPPPFHLLRPSNASSAQQVSDRRSNDPNHRADRSIRSIDATTRTRFWPATGAEATQIVCRQLPPSPPKLLLLAVFAVSPLCNRRRPVAGLQELSTPPPSNPRNEKGALPTT